MPQVFTMDKHNKRSSILKRPVGEESSPTFTRSTRRISFSGKKNVKEFMPGDGGATIWITSYEESAEVAPANSTKGNLYGGPQATPELIMRLRNNKVISKIPQTVKSKAKKSTGVENIPPVTKSHEEEEQLSRKFCESLDISLSVSEIQKLKMSKGEQRLPLRPIAQHSEPIDTVERLISPQTSLTCPSPGKIYCSFALTNNEIIKLSKLNRDRQLDLTLADILTESDKKVLHENSHFNNHGVTMMAMDMVNETNTSKPKRETMFNLENMELVSIQKSPNKRATTYYFDSLELSLKNNEKQRVSFNRLRQLDTPYEFQEENASFVEDCDKENKKVCLEPINMELSFSSILDSMKFDTQKNTETKGQPLHDVNNVKNKGDDMNKENCGYIDMEDCMDLSETVNNINRNDSKNPFQNIHRLEKQLPVYDLTAKEERNLDKMDISLSPAALSHSMHVNSSRNKQTTLQSYGPSLTVQKEIIANKEIKLLNCTKINETVLKEDQENKNSDIPVTDGTGNKSKDYIDYNIRRQTINIPCDLDLTMQDDKLHVNEESVYTKTTNRKLCFNKSEFLDASQHSITSKTGLNLGAENYKNHSEYLSKENIKCTEKRRTVLNVCDLDLTLQDEKQLVHSQTLIDKNSEKVLQSHSVPSKCIEKRRTVYNTCDLDLTLENDSKLPKLRTVDNNSEEVLQGRSNRNRLPVHNTCDLDLTLENSSQLSDAKPFDEKSKEIYQKLPDKNLKLENRRTVYNTCELDLTLENTAQFTDNELIDKKSEEIYQKPFEAKRLTVYKTEDLDLTLDNIAQLADNKLIDVKSEEIYQKPSEENIKFSEKRRTVYNTCDLELTLQDDLQLGNAEIGINNKQEKILENHSEMEIETCINILPRSPFNWGKKRVPHIKASMLKDFSRPNTQEISKDKRETAYAHCDLDFTLQRDDQQLPNKTEIKAMIAESTETKNHNFKNDQCMNLSIERSQILETDTKVSGHEKADCRMQQQTLYNHLDLNFTLEEGTPGRCSKKINSKVREVEVSTRFIDEQKHELQQKTIQDEEANSRINRKAMHNLLDLDLTLEPNSESNYVKPRDLNLREENIDKTNSTEYDISQTMREYKEENCKMKRRSVYTPLDMDLEEGSKSAYVKPTDFKEESKSSLKLKEEEVMKYSDENKMASSINFTQQGYTDMRCIKRSLPSAADSLGDKDIPKQNVIFSTKRQTTYEQYDLDITMGDEADQKLTEIVESNERVLGDFKAIRKTNANSINSKNNTENNISSMKRQTTFSPVNLDLTIQNDLKDKTDVINNEQTVETICTTASVKNNIQYNVEPSHRTEIEFINKDLVKNEERQESREIKTAIKTIAKREEYNAQQEESMTLTSNKLQSSSHQNKTLNMVNKSLGKNSNAEGNSQPSLQDLKRRVSAILRKDVTACEANNSSVQIMDFTIEEGAKGSDLANMRSLNSKRLKSTEWNLERNSIKDIDLSGCEQLDQTSEVIFCDLSSSNGTMDLGIESLRNAESVTETSEIPRLSSCNTNTTNSTFSGYTTQALCNTDFNKITKKGYKANLKKTSDFNDSSYIGKTCKDTCFDNSYEYIHHVPTADDIQKIDLSVRNLHLNCTGKDVNLKNDNCENKLKNVRTTEVKSGVDRQQSFCSRCKACDCNPISEGNKSDITAFSLKLKGPSQPCEVDFSGYAKFRNLPSVKDVFDAHKIRRESLNFESYEESVFCPVVPSMDFLLENYENQYKLQVERELTIGAMFPLVPSLEVLLSNKLESENFGWELNTLYMPVGVMEFRHDIIPSVTLVLKYSPNSFYSTDDKVSFEKVQLKISNLYGNSSPFDRIIENEIGMKAPYDLINYCSCFNDLFSFLSFMNSICEKAIQLGKELFKRVVGFNGSVERDNSDVCFIKKTARYAPGCNQKNYLMSTQDFLVRVRNIEKISYTDIMLPPLSDFNDSICSMPEGLEFLTKFFSDPISYLKYKP